MKVREANDSDRREIVALYKQSQLVHGLPDPRYYPPEMLEEKLYARKAIKRFVALENGIILGHGMIEHPNPDHMAAWMSSLIDKDAILYELGGAFVDPARSSEGIWTELLKYRIDYVRSLRAVPVTATWAANQHVMRVFDKLGGKNVGVKKVHGGKVCLYVFSA